MIDDSAVEDTLNQKNWQDERRKLRDILLDAGLEERVKWGKLYSTMLGRAAMLPSSTG